MAERNCFMAGCKSQIQGGEEGMLGHLRTVHRYTDQQIKNTPQIQRWLDLYYGKDQA